MREVGAATTTDSREIVALVVRSGCLVNAGDNHQSNSRGYDGNPGEVSSGVVRKWDEKRPDLKAPIFRSCWTRRVFRRVTILWWRPLVRVSECRARASRDPHPQKGAAESHPLLMQLAKYGGLQDVRMRIDSEMRSEGGGEKFGTMQITTNWLIHAAAYKTNVMRRGTWCGPIPK